MSPGTGLTQLLSLPWQLSTISMVLRLEGLISDMAHKWHERLSNDWYCYELTNGMDFYPCSLNH